MSYIVPKRQHRLEFLYLLDHYQSMVVVGETGMQYSTVFLYKSWLYTMMTLFLHVFFAREWKIHTTSSISLRGRLVSWWPHGWCTPTTTCCSCISKYIVPFINFRIMSIFQYTWQFLFHHRADVVVRSGCTSHSRRARGEVRLQRGSLQICYCSYVWL